MNQLTFLDFFVHFSWSPSGHTSGHFRPLAAYGVTSLSIDEANNLRHANNQNDGHENNGLQIQDPLKRIYNYHWSVTE